MLCSRLRLTLFGFGVDASNLLLCCFCGCLGFGLWVVVFGCYGCCGFGSRLYRWGSCVLLVLFVVIAVCCDCCLL